MTRDEAVLIINQRMSRFTANAILDAHIVTEMKAYQEKLEGKPFLPWFLLEESSFISTVVGEERVPVPVDFIQEIEEDALWLEMADGSESQLRKEDYDFMRKRYPGTTNAKPLTYALMGSYFRLRPKPDAIYTLRMMYFQNDVVLTTNVENQWLKYAADLLIAGTGFVIASQYIKNKDAAQVFRVQEQEAYSDLISTDQARTDANRTYQAED